MADRGLGKSAEYHGNYGSRAGRGLVENPAVGDLIQGGRGLRKVRVPLPGRGKRGGGRVIYYHWQGKNQCYLVSAYAKNVTPYLTRDQLQRLAAAIGTELDHE